MGGELIKSFLVGLGFQVNDSELAAFNKALASATLRVAALYTSIQVAAAGIFASLTKISADFEEMGYAMRLVAPSVNKFLLLRRAMLDAYRAAGVNLVQAVQTSIKFNFSLAKTKYALEAIYKSVGLKFLPLLTKQMDQFRARVFANMPKIQATLEKFIKVIFRAFTATVILGERLWSILGRVYDAFAKLDEATSGWSTIILGMVAAWKLLNLSFLASPLGLVLVGLLAILALYDDFKTFQEGGESFFDWSQALGFVKGITQAFDGLIDIVKEAVTIFKNWYSIFYQLGSGNFTGALNALKNVGQDLVGVYTSLWHVLLGLGTAFSGLGDIAGNVLGRVFGGGGSNAHTALNAVSSPPPLVTTGGGVNQRVHQETNIHVQGSADANAVGKAVGNEQSKVNFDLTRNLAKVAQ
jgi:hypothetical protein